MPVMDICLTTFACLRTREGAVVSKAKKQLLV